MLVPIFFLVHLAIAAEPKSLPRAAQAIATLREGPNDGDGQLASDVMHGWHRLSPANKK
jgi:hypothetical protein